MQQNPEIDRKMPVKTTPKQVKTTPVAPLSASSQSASGIDFHFWISIAIIILTPLIFLFPLVFEGKTFPASDTQQWLGTARVLMDYVKTTGEMALWNPNVFGGMPGYMISLPNPVPGLDSWGLSLVSLLIDWRATYLIFMGIGAFLYARTFTTNSYLAAFAAIAFMLSTYFIIILKVGHNTKFQAIAFIPWMFLSFNYLLKTINWKSAAFFALILSLQLRASHPQITYYTLLALAVPGILWLFDLIKAKNWKTLSLGGILIAGAFLLAGLSIAFPYLVNYEYSKFTIRAGTLASGSAGLSADYALSWSFDWVESVTFFAANYFGGHSPFYWWQMPFTEGPQYLGAILLLLAALTFTRPLDRLTLSLWVISLITWVLSMGSNFQVLANLMMTYFPFFNKFRTPSMILVILSLTIPVLAVIGVRGFIEETSKKGGPAAYMKKVWLVFGGVFAFGLLLLFASGSLSFLKPGETAQYDAQTIDYLKQQRAELSSASVWKFLIFNLLAMGLLIGTAYGKIRENLLAFLLLLLILTDLWAYNRQYLEELKSKKTYESSFAESGLDQFLLNDKSDFRILPVGNLFQSTRFNYYHQSIGGYHGAKLANFQNIYDQCLYKGTDPQLPFNWGILQAFGIKYLVIPQPLNQQIGPLLPAFIDDESRQTAMEFTGYRGKYFFTEKTETIGDLQTRIDKLNTPGWDPKKVTYLNVSLPEAVGFDSLATVTEVSSDLHKIELKTSSKESGFLFLSEIYYPAGWKAYVDGTETPVYEANVAFRGITVPAGTHSVALEFKPEMVPASLTMSYTGSILLYGLVLSALVILIRNRKNV